MQSLTDLLDLAVGYQKSLTLFTFVELKIADILQKSPFSAADVAHQIKIHPLAAERFLNACVSIEILRKIDDLYANSDIAEQFLTKGSEFFLSGPMNRYQNRSLPQWLELTDHLNNWRYGEQQNEDPDDADQGAEAMAEQHNLALLHGYALCKSFDFSGVKTILDLGGGTGATSIALCKKYSHLKSIVFDLPANTDVAAGFISKSGTKNQIQIIGGDFQKDELPLNFDAVILANFMAVADADTNKKLLAKLYDRLPSGGACILSGWIIDDSHLAPQISVLFCLEDICWNAPDVERSEKIYTEWLAAAGFVDIECKTYLEPTKLLYGFKK